MFNTNIIKINQDIGIINTNKKKDHFYYKKTCLQPFELKVIVQKYIKPILTFILNKKNDYDLCIHIRSGDIFSRYGCHAYYVQPPLKYYHNIIEEYRDKKILIVAEDKKNPCINELLKLDNISFQSSSVEEDIKTLVNCKNVVVGFGTFGLLIYFLSKDLKKFYIPKYSVETLLPGDYGDTNIISVDLPNYIKLGEWKNTKKQREFMLTYS